MKFSHNRLSASYDNVKLSTFRIKDGYSGKLLGHGLGFKRHIFRVTY